jgi:hypothetical protein
MREGHKRGAMLAASGDDEGKNFPLPAQIGGACTVMRIFDINIRGGLPINLRSHQD